MKRWLKSPPVSAVAALLIFGLTAARSGQVYAADAAPPPQPIGGGPQTLRGLEYASVNGRKLLVDLALPERTTSRVPVIVAIHGGGWAAGRKEEAQGLREASRGYAVAAISYRLSGEAVFPAQIVDCKAAVRWLRANAARYGLDADRIGAVGHSAGGHLSSLLGTSARVTAFEEGENRTFSSEVKAVCALSGPTDFLQMDAHAPPAARLKHDSPASPEARLIGGPVQENKAKVAQANPITYVTKNCPPFLLIHGDQDPVVPAHQSELLYEALKKAGVEARLHLVAGAGHGIGGPEVNDLMDAFFDKHLKKATKTGAVAPAPLNAVSPLAGPASPPTPPPAIRPPAGLFVCRGPSATPEREVDFDFVDGWLVRPGWSVVEPKEGEYDWSYIDRELALAKKLKKKITLAILGGPQTPAWVYQAGASEFAYNLPVGPRGAARIPLLWDPIYLKKWTSLVRALGKRYADEESIVLVHVTGATGNGLEMQLPLTPPDRQNWDRLGYQPEKVAGAWKQIIDTFSEAFPRLPLDLDIHPVLDSDQVATEAVAYGSNRLGKRFGVFGGWLSGKSASIDVHHAGMQELAKQYGPRGFSAWQLIASYTRTPNQYPETGLRAAIEQGMTWNARYFEIWETDAMNERLQPLLRELAAKLRR